MKSKFEGGQADLKTSPTLLALLSVLIAAFLGMPTPGWCGSIQKIPRFGALQ
jgi:hypothetical protein